MLADGFNNHDLNPLDPEFRPVRNGCPVGSVAALLPVV